MFLKHASGLFSLEDRICFHSYVEDMGILDASMFRQEGLKNPTSYLTNSKTFSPAPPTGVSVRKVKWDHVCEALGFPWRPYLKRQQCTSNHTCGNEEALWAAPIFLPLPTLHVCADSKQTGFSSSGPEWFVDSTQVWFSLSAQSPHISSCSSV